MLLFTSSIILTIGMFLDIVTTYIGTQFFDLTEKNEVSAFIEKQTGIAGLTIFNLAVWAILLYGNFILNIPFTFWSCIVVGAFRSFIGVKNQMEWMKTCIN